MSTNLEKAAANDLEVKSVVFVGQKNGPESDPIVLYFSTFKGKQYAHLRSIYQDKNGKWLPGKGLSFAAENAKAVFGTIANAITTIPG